MSVVKLSLDQIARIRDLASAIYDRWHLRALGIDRKSYVLGFVDGMRENIKDYKTAERARKRAESEKTIA